MNVIVRLEYELAYYDSAVHRFNHNTTRTPPSYKEDYPGVYSFDKYSAVELSLDSAAALN